MWIAGARGPLQDRLPQLDGLRAVAIAAVLVQHGFPDSSALVRALPWGGIGVRLFFVLSGFLITGILLKCRSACERGEATTGQVLRRFYARRALRILPVYYGVLGVGAALDAPAVRDHWVWLATFTTNFALAWQAQWAGVINHLWTLAVEEQFYLLWPWLVLLVSRRRLVAVLLCAVAAAPLWRTLSMGLGHAPITTHMVSFSAFDALAMGSLLAAARQGGVDTAVSLERLRRVCLVGGGPLLGLVLGLHATGLAPAFRLVTAHLAMALFFTWVVDRAADGFGGAAGRFLGLAPVRYLGRISYGVYVYHLFVRYALWWAVGQGMLAPPPNPGVRFLWIAAISIALGALSWELFERPINDLKRRFPYTARRAGPRLRAGAPA